MVMVKTKEQLDKHVLEAAWQSKDPLTQFLFIRVMKLAKGQKATKYGFPYMWAVMIPSATFSLPELKGTNGIVKASGFARNMKAATTLAEVARSLILRLGAAEHQSSDKLFTKLEDLIAD